MKYCIIIFFLFTSCKQQKGIHPDQMTDGSSYLLDEKFEDSLNIGYKGRNKVIIEKFKKNGEEDIMVILRFFARKNIWKNGMMTNMYQWQLSDKFYFEKNGFIGITPAIDDFNNDGFMDLTYISGTAVRGANEVRKLFLYDTLNNTFVYIKNSDSYPNLFYNKELDCINSHIFTGCTTTAFPSAQKGFFTRVCLG